MWSDLKVRLSSLFRRGVVEREMADEVRAHIEHETEKLIRTGLPKHEARRAAIAAFGGIEVVKEHSRDARGTRWIEDAWHDVRHAVRLLGKQKRFTAALVLTMALGIGANTAVTAAIDEILWRPLTMPNAERLVSVWGFDKASSKYQQLSMPDIRDLSRAASFQAFAAYWRRPMPVTFGTQAATLSGEVVTAGYFQVLTAPFIVGRPFSTDDETALAPVAVISERLWRERFGASGDVIGQTITLEAHRVPIVGVASRQFRGDHNLNWYTAPDVWIPASALPSLLGTRWEGYLQNREIPIFVGLGRLQLNASPVSAGAEVDGIFAGARQSTPAAATQTVRVFPAAESKFYPGYRAEFSTNLSAFGIATLLLLLLAAANVANLLVERTTRRRRELALRTALGAGQGRLIRQLFVEGLVLAVPGCAVSLLIAAGLQQVLMAFPKALGVQLSISLDITSRVFAYCCGVSLLLASAVSVVPAIRSARSGVGPLLKHATAGSSLRRSWVGQSLTVFQVGVSAVLLVGSLVIAGGLWVAHTVRLGFEPSQAIVLSLNRFMAASGEAAPLPPGVLDRGGWLPAGVTHVALSSDEPFTGLCCPISIKDTASPGASVPVYPHFVSSSFFDTLQIPLLSGRTFDESDVVAGQTVLINHALSHRLWGSDSPLGRFITIGSKAHTVVGVVGDTRYYDAWDSDVPQIYRPIDASSDKGRTVLARTSNPPELILPVIVRAWNGMAPDVPIEEAMTGAALKARGLEPMRLMGALVGVFTLVAIAIAGVGLYSTITWLVEQRSREIAVRIAIGGLPARIGRRVMAHALALTLAGSAVGFAIATTFMPRLIGLTHGLAPYSLGIVTVGAAVLIAVAIVAAAVPARRAVRIDPIALLKSE